MLGRVKFRQTISGETRDGGDHAARVLPFAAIREELGGLAAGAHFTIEDAPRVHARSLHLTAVRLREVELTLAACPLPFRKERGELRFDFRSDSIATFPNTRTDGRIYIRRSGSEMMAHALEGTDDNLRGCPTPAGMHRGNSTCAAIQQQKGNTISSSDADALSDIVRDQGIAFRLPIMQWMCVQNPIRVDLTQGNVNRWVRLTGTETVCLPNELLKGIATIDAV